MISRGPFQYQQFCDSWEVTLPAEGSQQLNLHGKEFLLIKLAETFISSADL